MASAVLSANLAALQQAKVSELLRYHAPQAPAAWARLSLACIMKVLGLPTGPLCKKMTVCAMPCNAGKSYPTAPACCCDALHHNC